MKSALFRFLAVALLLAQSSSANAFFFIFIPGSAIDALGDALTGATGDNCVRGNTSVGDRIRLTDGSIHEVLKLSGTSTRCQTSEFPIRALLGPPITAQTSPNKAAFGIDLPAGWASVDMGTDIKAKGFLFQGINRTIDSGLLVSFVVRNGIINSDTFVKTREIAQESNLNDANSSQIDRFVLSKNRVWQFYTTGTLKNGSNAGKQMMYQTTIIEGKTQIVEIKVWAFPATFEAHKKELAAIARAIKGL